MAQLESLANELLLDFFEFFTTAHLLQAFVGLNSRFNQLLYHHIRTHPLDLQSLSKQNFDIISKQYLPLIIGHITSFRISSDESPGLPELLLSRGFTLDRFICLQSLSLHSIDYVDTLNKIIYQCRHLPCLTHLNIIKSNDRERRINNSVDFLNNIWSLSTLTHCNLSGLYADEALLLNISIVSPRIEYLSIQNIPCTLNCLSHLLKFTPRLRQLCTTIYSYLLNDHLECIVPLLKSIKLVFGGTFNSLNNLLRYMPNLSHLTITTVQVYFDGKTWEQLISAYFPQLKVFQLKMEVEFREVNITIEDVIDRLLASFQTSFWLEERQWYVRCHWNPSDPYKWVTLYTLPYCFDGFDYSNKSCTKSTCSDEGNYWSYDCVKLFGHGTAENTLLDNFSLLRARFRNICHLQVNIPFDDRFWSRFPSLNYLTSLHVSIYKHSGFGQLQTVFDQATCLYSLKLQSFFGPISELFQLTSKSIRRIDLMEASLDQSMYFNEGDCFILINSTLANQCEVLSIRVKHRKNVLDLIQRMSNLRLLMFECEDDKEFFRRFSSVKNELVRWLQSYTPSPSIITRHPAQQFLIRVWINRETNKMPPSHSYILKSKQKTKLSQFLTAFRQYFDSILTE
ncbi:unnamed protein product [Rotaria magnacalcarata]|uniref:F-box domain-containing protein n=1 Tax=Rotaria magnacalcarata TaxID=392030 RepID=A0A816SG92_9BILA|nr:unnamed protein product [Rotaria magnacalcarata]CAF2083449.1 unnamed protein product [Rotaria magnacalcarata]CAF2207930.1 unnamed protein product [Rotaria magnacalcarata]CAF3806344.1 unnamed protein product [Rotaria magnacalcarata]CAF3976552.1 unnamed protein product [Rotaria magnacalcarata]